MNKFEKAHEEFEEWENSIEGIHYSLTLFGDVFDNHGVMVCKVLQQLPKSVRMKVLEEVNFIVIDKDLRGHPFSMTLFPRKEKVILYFIILNFGAMENMTEKGIMSIIAHERAHHVLGHDSSTSDPDAEKKADDLCEKWGFGRAYDYLK